MILFFTVDKQIITRRDNEKVVRDSVNYLHVNFSFSEEWTGDKTAVFKSKSGIAYNVLVDSDGSCLVPWEVLKEEYFEVSAFCGDLITANVVKVFTIQSGYEIGSQGRIPTPDIYTQIIARLSAIEDEIDPTAIQQIVDEYISDKGYVTETDVEQIVSDYVEAHKDELKGDTGATGPQGPQGVQGPKGDTGEGVPTGGTTSQVLIKSSDADYDTEWGTIIDDGKVSADTAYSSEKITNILGNKVFVGKKSSGTLIDGIFIHTNGNSYASSHWKVFVIPVENMASINVGGIMNGYTKTQVSKYRWAFYDNMITAENYSTKMTSSHCIAIAPCDGGEDIGVDVSTFNWDDLLQVPSNAVCCVVSVPNSLVSNAIINEGIAFDYADKSCITVMNADAITSDVVVKFDALGIAKNTILDIVSMYSGETQPSVVGKTSLVTTKAYPISDVGFYKRNTLRYPYELKGERNTITITVPSGTTLNIKEMAVKFADERFDAYGVEMISHNGANQMCPDNTAPAFEWAGKLGYKRLITQLHVTSDGEIVCIHDSTINNTARNMDGTTISETIAVADHTYAELCQYDYGIKKNAYWAKTKLPTFDEYLDICAAYGMMPEISMHIGNMGANAWAKVKSALEKRNMVDKITFKAFNGSILQYAWDVFGDTVRGYGIDVSKDGSISDKITELETVIGQNYGGKKFVEIQRTNVNSTNVNAILSAGYECHVWDISTLWEVSDYINAINLGVSAFTDDYNWQNGMLWK